MNQNSASRRFPVAGFTLVELLTVIAIIAILMALLFPAIQGAKEAARRAQAGHDVQNIVAAVKSYNTEYGRYPDISATATAAATSDTIVGGLGGQNNSLIFNTLRAISVDPNTNDTLNPRRVPFFEGKVASSSTTPKAGFSPNGAASSGSYFDPWGTQYGIVIDANYDNMIDVHSIYSDFSTTDSPRVGVGAFAHGKDLKAGTDGDGRLKDATGKKSDDVVSWQ